jgi:hypothetical protein
MREIFARLQLEQVQIGRAVDSLMAVLDDATAAELTARLRTLADIVYDHIAGEDALAQRLDAAIGHEPAERAWRHGMAAFTRLRTEWLTFLHRWEGASIRNDRAGFVAEARTMLDRVMERVELETHAFHAAAAGQGLITSH